MKFVVDRGLVTLFGSETRVRTLAPLANASTPLTAYRIAAIADLPRTKVYLELERLAEAGIVVRRAGGPDRSLWELNDPNLRGLIRRKVRIAWAGDLVASAPDLARRTRKVIAANRAKGLDEKLLRGPFRARDPNDFDRPPAKDAALARLGLRVSRRTRSRS